MLYVQATRRAHLYTRPVLIHPSSSAYYFSNMFGSLISWLSFFPQAPDNLYIVHSLLEAPLLLRYCR